MVVGGDTADGAVELAAVDDPNPENGDAVGFAAAGAGEAKPLNEGVPAFGADTDTAGAAPVVGAGEDPKPANGVIADLAGAGAAKDPKPEGACV